MTELNSDCIHYRVEFGVFKGNLRWKTSNSLGFRLRDCFVLVAQLCLTLWDPMDCNSPGSSVHRILQARILQWVTIPFSRRSSHPRDRTQVSCNACRFFTIWATSLFNKYLCSSLYAGFLLLGRWSFSKVRDRAGLMDIQPLCSQRSQH